ncbi:unnamed protein product [Oreochromis niloticus]|nr:unnamed protein product [Mustela putorius furo]
MVKEDDPQRLHRSSIDVLDPISDQFYEVWMFTSARYTSIYQKVFHCLPSSDVGGLPGQCWPGQRGPGSEELKKILGFLVSFLFTYYPSRAVHSWMGPVPSWGPWGSGPSDLRLTILGNHHSVFLSFFKVTNWTCLLRFGKT